MTILLIILLFSDVHCLSNDQTLPVGSAALKTARLSQIEYNQDEDLLHYNGSSEDYRVPIKLNRGTCIHNCVVPSIEN